MTILIQGIEQYQIPDDSLFRLGNDNDGVLLLKSASILANTTWPDTFVGTPVTPALPANSVILSNITASGDILLATNKGGNSIAGLWLDGSAGDAALMASSSASVDHYIAGTKVLDHSAGAFAFQEATIISSTGAITINGVTSVVFNETGADVDFRIEGSGEANAFFVQGSDGKVGIGTAAPAYALDIRNAATRVVDSVTLNSNKLSALSTTDYANNVLPMVGAHSTGATIAVIFIGGSEELSSQKTATEIQFHTATVGTTGSAANERMRITSTGNITIGNGEGGTTVATGNTLRATDITTGGAGNIAGADLTIAAGLGTGTGDVGTIIFSLPIVAAAGDNIQTTAARMTLDMAGSTTLLTMTIAQDMTITGGNLLLGGTLGLTGTRVSNIFTTSQTTTNAETVDSWGMTKQHITPYDDALAVLRGISVVAYEHKSTFDPSGRRKLGVLAESVAERMVTPFDEYVGLGRGPRLDMLGLAAINTRAIQQVDGEVETIKRQIATLEARLKLLEVPNATDPD